MRRVWIVRSAIVFGLALAATLLVSGRNHAQARPQYLIKAFRPSYPQLEAETKKVKCNICHFGKKKTNRNNYGSTLHEALGEGAKNIKDADKVKAALKVIEEKESAVDGKTFGQLIEEGKLPATGFEPEENAAAN